MPDRTRPSRRRLLTVAGLAPAGLLAARFLDGARSGIGALRPHRSGTSAERCATCGQAGHTMLDAACPAGPGLTTGGTSWLS